MVKGVNKGYKKVKNRINIHSAILPDSVIKLRDVVAANLSAGPREMVKGVKRGWIKVKKKDEYTLPYSPSV